MGSVQDRNSDRPRTIVVRLANNGKLLFFVALVNVLTCASLYSATEHKDLLRSTYFSIVTAFTVGYGDESPKTTFGMLLVMYFIISMFMLLAILTARILSSVLHDDDEWTHEEQEAMKQQLATAVSALTETQELLRLLCSHILTEDEQRTMLQALERIEAHLEPRSTTA